MPDTRPRSNWTSSSSSKWLKVLVSARSTFLSSHILSILQVLHRLIPYLDQSFPTLPGQSFPRSSSYNVHLKPQNQPLLLGRRLFSSTAHHSSCFRNSIHRDRVRRHHLGESDLEILRTYEWMNYLSGQVHARRFGVYFRAL